MSCWKENKSKLVEWIDGCITSIAKKLAIMVLCVVILKVGGQLDGMNIPT